MNIIVAEYLDSDDDDDDDNDDISMMMSLRQRTYPARPIFYAIDLLLEASGLF